MKETKSQRLFRHAFREAVDAVEFWGTGKVDALSSLHDGTDENICQRTVNGIRKCAEHKESKIKFDEQRGELRGEDVAVAVEALAIVFKTCDNWERDERKFKAARAAL